MNPPRDPLSFDKPFLLAEDSAHNDMTVLDDDHGVSRRFPILREFSFHAFVPVQAHPGLSTVLPACFINQAGDIEPAAGSMLAGSRDFDAWQPSASQSVFGLIRLSEREALTRLRRAQYEAGQLIVRTADDLMDVWFAGIGDPENLFVELFPRDRPADHHEAGQAGVYPLADAERMLGCIYHGIGSGKLSALFSSEINLFDAA